MSQNTAADRSKAYRLRMALKAGQPIDNDDDAWLDDYTAKANAGTSPNRATKSSRVMHFEETDACAEGESASTALAAGWQAREEGRRYDALLNVGISAMKDACLMYHQMCKDLLARTAQLEKAQLDLTTSLSEQFLARTKAEGDSLLAMRKADMDSQDYKHALASLGKDEESEDNPAVKMFEQALMAKIAGGVMAGPKP